jgi:DnaJ-class molecular chaperone
MGLFGFLFGDDYGNRARRDQYRLNTVGKNLISPINSYGTCFGCEGSGRKTLDCKICNGTGTYSGACKRCAGAGTLSLAAKPCFGCQGTGRIQNHKCNRCKGTGQHKPAIIVTCNKCSGKGRISGTCHKCSGRGQFTVTCRKCGGSGWHRF